MNKLSIISLIVILTSNLNAQNMAFNKPKSNFCEKVELKIKTDNRNYNFGDTIWIEYELKNISDSIQTVLIKDHWHHPMGMTASIFSDNDSSICKYPTKSIYSSQIYTDEQLKGYYKSIEVNSMVGGKVALQNIPVFKDYIKDDIIPRGIYRISLGYYLLISNTIMIEIK